MKITMTFLITILSLTVLGGEGSHTDQRDSNQLETYMSVASDFLGVDKELLEVASESDQNIFIWETYAIDDDNHPCHVGVVVHKTHLAVISQNYDENLQLHFPYADTFFQADNTIQVCAD